MNPLLSACQVDSSRFRLPCALTYARFYDKIYVLKSLNITRFRGAKYIQLFVDVAFLSRFLHSISRRPAVWLELIASILLLLFTDRIFILVRFFLRDAVAYVFVETFLCFFQQFDRLAYVFRARFIGLFLDPLSTRAPHESNLTVYVCCGLFCVLYMPYNNNNNNFIQSCTYIYI